MKNKVTILVNSCDLYEDAWEPFFRLLEIQWPECKYNIVLNTETKQYMGQYDIKTINTKIGIPWSKRLKKVVKQIDSEYIMFFLEDEFLRSPVNNKCFENTITFMDKNPDVGYILMKHSGKQKIEIEEPYFERNRITDKYQIVGLSALYRKDFLLNILRNHESPWDYEAFATDRLKKSNYKAMQYNKNMPCIFDYDDTIENGYGITKRRWLKSTKVLLDSFGIDVNYENLGWYEDLEEQEIPRERWSIRKLKNIKKKYYRWKSLR